MTQIEKLEAVLQQIGLRANAWKGCRIYINGYGRDIKAFFHLEHPAEEAGEDLLEGVALRVFSNANQPMRWCVNRAKQVKHSIMLSAKDAGLVDDVCDDWQQVVL
jgi:hypothetical protein